MAKKKNISKKHKFKHVDQAAEFGTFSNTDNTKVLQPSKTPVVVAGRASGLTSDGRDFSYVGGDVQRIAILAVSLIILEIVLYFLLVHTSIGPSLYQHISI
jgi:hypothetical protein